MKYERRAETIQAQQWKGKLEDITVAKIRQVAGLTGYQGKLAYYDKPDNNVVTVRPGDFICKRADGSVFILSEAEFDKTYKEVANTKKSANNSTQSKKTEDNFIK